MKVIIVGGGWSGCAAAVTAKKAGAEVTILEKTDLLLGLGNVGGIIRNNGRYTAAEELISLGLGDLFNIIDSSCRHKNVSFPHHEHASFYDVSKIEPAVTKYLMELGIDINTMSRVVSVEHKAGMIKAAGFKGGGYIEGDVFIDATGSAGAVDNCMKYGNGCVMCILRCPSFGGRVSISALVGVKDIVSERPGGTPGAFSGSCEIPRDCLSEDIIRELDEKGVKIINIPAEDVNMGKLNMKICQQYAYKEFSENAILIDTGHVKLMTPFYPIHKLRKIKGLERVRFMDPYSGGEGNSIRFMASAPRSNDMKVIGANNLFCAGEKSGFFIGHTEAIATGSLAGHNAVKHVLNQELLVLPEKLAVGDIIAYANSRLLTPEGKQIKVSFSGTEYFERMKSLGLYSVDREEIDKRVTSLGLKNIFNKSQG